jgi:RHS repeat-associated protein
MSNTKGTSVITTPKGGGAQGGLGEKFSPDLFTGTGNFSVPIALPSGRNGFQPELSLGYSSGNGNSVFGAGWNLSIPGVMRKTSKGIPVYDDTSDIFVLSGAEDLVPVKTEQESITANNIAILHQKTYYRPRTEGLFARIIHHKKSNGINYWEVRSKDGLISYYGNPDIAADQSDCIISNPEHRTNIFCWSLHKTVDVFGNDILYSYDRELKLNAKGRSYDQIYLKKIHYANYDDNTQPTGKNYLCEIRFNYEERPDAFSSYKQGFEIRTTKRTTSIETYTNAATLQKTKVYHLVYENAAHKLPLNGMSLLTSVKVKGIKSSSSGEESEFMPPLVFSYSVFTPQKRELKTIKGPIPPQSLSEPGFELMDVTGNGLPDIVQLNGTARYWTNKGYGQFSPPRELNISPSVQLGTQGVQVIDANGDGRSDLLVNNGVLSGYYPGAFKKVWDTNGFKPYKAIPSFSFNDPEVQLMDLDGDGITDVLRNGAQFECFYNDPEKGFYKVKTTKKTFTNFSFADPRIRFADMTGDGLQDIILISSGRVQYWPNMGYGKFGEKINMTNAPVFPEQYDPSQILIGDVDGDGQADIVFVENNKVTLYINQSGNGFSKPVEIKGTPRLQNPKAIRLTDIMGTGQASLVWSFSAFSDAAVGAAAAKMYSLDFTRGNKPYVLEQMNNNMGSITRVKYGSSVYHYLRDDLSPQTRWQTELPFAVQVVNKVEVLDLLSGGKLVTEYAYHHGYWDGAEREFRGFAQVDSTDTESFTKFNAQDLLTNEDYFLSSEDNTQAINATAINGVTAEHYAPPVLTKSWFYLGATGDLIRYKEPDFSQNYWQGDTSFLTRDNSTKQLLESLPPRARRDALRTLRGSLLRSELYALDNSPLQYLPYTVTESVMGVRMELNPTQLAQNLQTHISTGFGVQGGYIFFPFNTAQRTSQYERGTDPMHSFSFTKNYDAYGQALAQLSLALPRGASMQGGGQGDYLGTYSETQYIYKDLPAQPTEAYMVNRVKKTTAYDATTSAQGQGVLAVKDFIFSNYNPTTLPVINCSLNYYDGNAFMGLPFGQIDNYGAQVRSETLILTDAHINAIYGTNTPECFKANPDWITNFPVNYVNELQNNDVRLGYKDRRTGYPDHIPGWYAESARVKYDFQTGQTNFKGLTLESKDTFNVKSDIQYDVYQLLPVISKQYLNVTDYLQTTAQYDYHILQPEHITDANANISVFDYSPLGLLKATALIGKGTEGDYRQSSGDFYDKYEPSVKMDYDFFAFINDGNPVWVKTISREQHYQQSALSNTIVKVEYSDGFGRLLQTRVQAEDVLFNDSGLPINQTASNAPAIGVQRAANAPLNVVVSGYTIYNNKGKAVEQYEPYFDTGFDYSLTQVQGVKARMYYDSLGRMVRTKNPDGSEQRVLFGIPTNLTNPDVFAPSPWENYTYDANDLASVTNVPNNNVQATHYFTPKRALIDALGRTIQTEEFFNNSNYADTVVMNYVYDIRGNLLYVKDPYSRTVFEYKYDLRTPGKEEKLPPLFTKHIDKGISSIVLDVQGKPVMSEDAKGAKSWSAVDAAGRPTKAWAVDNASDTIRLRSVVQYKGVTSPDKLINMAGQAFKTFDESGCMELVANDFKGSPLHKKQHVIDYTLIKTALQNNQLYKVDWTNLPNILDNQVFETSMQYDALGRAVEIELPKDVSNARKKITPTYNNAGGLGKVEFDGTTYVENIAYDAKGQRVLIAFGNGIMTRYAYDTNTFRLKRQRSEKYIKTITGNTITYTPQAGSTKQDDGFDYDLVGNIMKILHRTTDCGIANTALGSDALDRVFTYDPLNRLLTASGRESDTNSGNLYIYDESPIPGSPNANHVRKYDRTYTYDKLGNIKSMVQSGVNGFTRDFVYNSNVNTLNKIQDASQVSIEDYTYDANGNQLTGGTTRNYSWNHADQLISFSGTNVRTQYDYSGQNRVSKFVKNGNDFERTIYIDGVFEYHILEKLSTTYEKNYVHVMDDSSRIVEVRIGQQFPNDINESVVYNLETEIGSSAVRLDINGTVIDKEEYYPFGDSSLRTFTYKRYRYVGKERDSESGLYYYGARYYSAWTCRFISIDPLSNKYAHITPYNYADNNPINDFDIDGMQDGNTQAIPVANQTGDKTWDAAVKSLMDAAEKDKSISLNIQVHRVKGVFTGGDISVTQNGKTISSHYTPGKNGKEGSFFSSANSLGGGLIGIWNNELRASYHREIAVNSQNNLDTYRSTSNAVDKERVVDKAIADRNNSKIEVRKKLTPDASEVTKRLEKDAEYTKDKLKEKYTKKNLKGDALNEEIIRASGRPSGMLKFINPIFRGISWGSTIYGGYTAYKNISKNPYSLPVWGEEVGGAIGGALGSIEGATAAILTVEIVATAILGVAGFALGGWAIIGVALVGSLIGAYIGSKMGGTAGRKLGEIPSKIKL